MQIRRFRRVLLFGCAVIPPLRLKSFCVRTQIAKTEYLPAEYIPPTFWLVHPLPLLRRLTVWAAIEKNFFWFSKHCFNSSSFHSVFIISFYLFSFLLVWFWFKIYFISLRIMASIWFLDFIFPILNSYSYFNFYFFCFLDSFLLVEFLLASISTCFSIVYSML